MKRTIITTVDGAKHEYRLSLSHFKGIELEPDADRINVVGGVVFIRHIVSVKEEERQAIDKSLNTREILNGYRSTREPDE